MNGPPDFQARWHPPTDARLILYGEAFADFLRECKPDGDWPYLQHLAREPVPFLNGTTS